MLAAADRHSRDMQDQPCDPLVQSRLSRRGSADLQEAAGPFPGGCQHVPDWTLQTFLPGRRPRAAGGSLGTRPKVRQHIWECPPREAWE